MTLDGLSFKDVALKASFFLRERQIDVEGALSLDRKQDSESGTEKGQAMESSE